MDQGMILWRRDRVWGKLVKDLTTKPDSVTEVNLVKVKNETTRMKGLFSAKTTTGNTGYVTAYWTRVDLATLGGLLDKQSSSNVVPSAATTATLEDRLKMIRLRCGVDFGAEDINDPVFVDKGSDNWEVQLTAKADSPRFFGTYLLKFFPPVKVKGALESLFSTDEFPSYYLPV